MFKCIKLYELKKAIELAIEDLGPDAYAYIETEEQFNPIEYVYSDDSMHDGILSINIGYCNPKNSIYNVKNIYYPPFMEPEEEEKKEDNKDSKEEEGS